MISRYAIFCSVVENGSFTRSANELGYTQSSISQSIAALEKELGVILLERRKDGVFLSEDGRSYYPYLSSIAQAEASLAEKSHEMQGLENQTITIGTFTSVSRTFLPGLMKQFLTTYPSVRFILKQEEYTSIEQWILDGTVDFGFVNLDAGCSSETVPLYQDTMVAVLPKGHALAKHPQVSLRALAKEPLILLDEGETSVPMEAFAKAGLSVTPRYKVYDDYSILEMCRQALGISILYENVLKGFEAGLEVRPIHPTPTRRVALGYRNRATMPLAAKRFASLVVEHFQGSNNPF